MSTEFAREASRACLYGYANKQQQASVASALILANARTGELVSALQEQIGECFDDRCEMCLRHETVIAKALGQPLPGSPTPLMSSEPNAATASTPSEARQDSDPSFVAGSVAGDAL